MFIVGKHNFSSSCQMIGIAPDIMGSNPRWVNPIGGHQACIWISVPVLPPIRPQENSKCNLSSISSLITAEITSLCPFNNSPSSTVSSPEKAQYVCIAPEGLNNLAICLDIVSLLGVEHHLVLCVHVSLINIVLMLGVIS